MYQIVPTMDKTTSDKILQDLAQTVSTVREAAFRLHDSVGQTYGPDLPYGHHLEMVASLVRDHVQEVAACEEDVLPILFAAYYHDSIEDARLTYNDVMKTARRYMTESQATMAAEIVYALTNDKGRTREERAGEKYYAGIRTTPYAPFVKLCDRMANMAFSASGTDAANLHMQEVYRREWPHFISQISVSGPDGRFSLPPSLMAVAF